MVQIMAWRCPGDKPLSEPMMVSLPTHICIARPQWVNIGSCISLGPSDNKLLPEPMLTKLYDIMWHHQGPMCNHWGYICLPLPTCVCVCGLFIPIMWYCRADSRLVPSQWETALQSNTVSHWLGANLESAVYVSEPCCSTHSDHYLHIIIIEQQPHHLVIRRHIEYYHWEEGNLCDWRSHNWVSVVVADGLVAIWHQGICNHRDDVAWWEECLT